MKKDRIWWTAGIVLGLSLSVSGCGEKKSASEISRSPAEAAPTVQAERPTPEGPPASSASDDQSPSGTSTTGQSSAGERKAPRS
jgi:hypothetical protein